MLNFVEKRDRENILPEQKYEIIRDILKKLEEEKPDKLKKVILQESLTITSLKKDELGLRPGRLTDDKKH